MVANISMDYVEPSVGFNDYHKYGPYGGQHRFGLCWVGVGFRYYHKYGPYGGQHRYGLCWAERLIYLIP